MRIRNHVEGCHINTDNTEGKVIGYFKLQCQRCFSCSNKTIWGDFKWMEEDRSLAWQLSHMHTTWEYLGSIPGSGSWHHLPTDAGPGRHQWWFKGLDFWLLQLTEDLNFEFPNSGFSTHRDFGDPGVRGRSQQMVDHYLSIHPSFYHLSILFWNKFKSM